MNTIYSAVHGFFESVPEAALFLSLALGYLVGKINFGKFQLGGVAGSLLMAVAVSQFGVHVDDTVKNMLFALFIYAVGYTSGPLFFRSLGKKSIREIALAAILAVSGLATVVVCAKLFGLDKGLAAGIAAGGLTQSAIMGTAESALNSMNLGAVETSRLVANISVGYGVTYIFGSFGTILVCVNGLQKLMGRSIRDDAIKAETAGHQGGLVLGAGEQAAVPDLVGRVFVAGAAAGKRVADLEQSVTPPLTVERIKRQGKIVPVSADTVLQAQDRLLVVGRASAMVAVRSRVGEELVPDTDLEIPIQTRSVVITAADVDGKSLGQIRAATKPDMRHGLYVVALSREGNAVSLGADTTLRRGDVLSLYGSGQDIDRATRALGYALPQTDKTDFIYLGFGLVFGLLIGRFVLQAGSIPITLGSGGGVLLAGLLFGWLRARRQKIGALPSAAAQILKDLGLAGFVVVVGLNYGMQAIATVKSQGLTILLVGAIVTILPLIIAMLAGKYLLKYDNVAVFAGALTGSRSANPAFGEVLNKAENSVPTVPFAVTYALANVFLTLLGPLVVALA